MLRISGGILKNHSWPVLKDQSIRPMTHMLRLSLFNMLEQWVYWPTMRVLDAFCGSGILGVEAYSRQAQFVSFWDLNPKTLRQIEANWKNSGSIL